MKEILSNNVPNLRHCWRDDYRCPRRSDDDVCCSRDHRPSNCFDANDFVCFDRRCVLEDDLGYSLDHLSPSSFRSLFVG